MTSYTQERQAMRVHTALEEDLLLLEGLTGKEAVSQPYFFELDLVSLDRDIDGEQLLRSPMHVEIDLPDGRTRSIHGIVRRFVQKGRDEELIAYKAEIVPWLWFLSLAQDCRIFQDLDVLEIVEAVFKEQGYSDFEMRCTRTYNKRDYCVQYRESNLNFVSRLLEEEGIFYFFEHQESKHVLVLADDMTAVTPCEGQPEARMHAQPVPDEDVVLSLDREHSVHPGQVTFADYDYLQPSLSLRSTLTGAEPEEIYDYPGGFTDVDGGEHRAQLALEREEAMRHVVRGSGTCRGFRAGGRFRLLDHFGEAGNQSYMILELRHQAQNGSYRATSGAGGFDYRNELVAIPHSVPYRPACLAKKPRIHGAQTAEVVGPGGERVWVDEYGRVKLQFPWDRQGGRDENSSCWVRVSQNWAGKQWGGMFIPHIGQEVIVEFLEGDPDRPIVTGRVYHAANMPPMKLPDQKHKSIIRDDFGNEIIFDATPGDEHISIHSPSHSSTLDIGRSTSSKTASETLEKSIGSKYEYAVSDIFKIGGGIGADVFLGAKFGLFAGLKGDIELASKLSLGAGVSASISWAGKFEYARSFSYTNVKGKSLTSTDGGITQQSKKRIRVDSAEEVAIIGGKDINSKITATTKGMLLTYGKGSRDDADTHNLAARNRMIGSTVAGLLASIGLTMGAIGAMAAVDKADAETKHNENNVPDDEKEKNQELREMDTATIATLAGTGLATFVGAGIGAAYAAYKSNDKPTENNNNQKQTKTDAEIHIYDQGVWLQAFNGDAYNASIGASNRNGGKIILLADEEIELKQAKKIILGASTKIEINAPTVSASKGRFETKNFYDPG